MERNNDLDKRQYRHRKPRGKKFTFLGGTPQTWLEAENSAETAGESIDSQSAMGLSFPLAFCRVSAHMRIVRLKGKDCLARHLLGTGLTPGAELQVISRTSSGSVIVALQDNHIGLGAGIAQRIMVTHSSREH